MPNRTFCRDRIAERLKEMIIIISRSDTQSHTGFKGADPPRLVITNLGCWRWTGWVRGAIHDTLVLNDIYDTVEVDSVAFEYKPEIERFQAISGMAVWNHSGTMSDGFCAGQGGGTYPVFTEDSLLRINGLYPETALSTPYYGGNGRVGPDIPDEDLIVTYTCGGGSTLEIYTKADFWFDTFGSDHIVDESGDLIEGQSVYTYTGPGGEGAITHTYEWHFEAQRE